VPVTLSFDPHVLSVVSVSNGTLMANAGIAATLSKRVDAAAGAVHAVINAAGAAPADAQPAQGSLLRVEFKALAASQATAIALPDAVKAVSAAGDSVVLDAPPQWRVQVQ
jgi:general secretion pathway protein D